MIQFKKGVKLGVSPEAAIAIAVVASVYEKCGYDCTVTSARDGEHKPGSLHYEGRAVDFRLNDLSGIPPADRTRVSRLAAVALGENFDVLHESPGTPNEHLHVEYDPKEKR